MAMTPIHQGRADGVTDNSFAQDNANFQTIYTAEVQSAFYAKNLLLPLTMVRTITNGKSATFPMNWKTSAQYFQPGDELTGQNSVNFKDITINVDQRVLSEAFVDELEELKGYYDVRSPITTAQGAALAEQVDINLLRNIIKAASATKNFAGDTDTLADRRVEDANMLTDADALNDALWEAKTRMDESNVPSEERHVVLGPRAAKLMFSTTGQVVLNRDWGGSGEYSRAVLPTVANFTLHQSNHMTAAALGSNYAGVTGEENDYTHDFTNTVGCAFHKSAVGTVKLKDISIDMEYMIRNQGTVIVSKYAMGHGVLRPESAIELATV